MLDVTRYALLMQLEVKNPKKTRNNVFRRKQTTNKAQSKIFTGFEVGKKLRVVFPKPKNKTKLNGTFSTVKDKQ